MGTSEDLLTNAKRLTADADFLHASGRSRSAATLIVIALEQLGAHVEAVTKQEYPCATVYLGLFGKTKNAHANRQDALAAHVMNFAMGQFLTRVVAENYVAQHGPTNDSADFVQWFLHSGPITLTDQQQQAQRECPDIRAAHELLHAVRTNSLKDLREYGAYEGTKRFTD